MGMFSASGFRGLDTCNTVLRGRFHGALARVFQMFHSAAGRRVWLRMELCQGWYPEGWAGPQVHLLFPAPPPGCQVKIEGDIPQLSPGSEQQVLSVRLNGRFFADVPLHPGPFCVTEALPELPARVETLSLDLIASTSIGRRMYGNGADPIAVCYRLRRVQITDCGSNGSVFAAVAREPANREVPLRRDREASRGQGHGEEGCSDRKLGRCADL